MGCPYANMSKAEIKKLIKPKKYSSKDHCKFCGLVHDKIGFFEGYPTSLKIEDDFAYKLKGNKNSVIKGKVYRE